MNSPNPTSPVSQITSKPLNIHIVAKKELAKSYMSFIKGGGLFIKMEEDFEFQPNQKIFVLLSLLEEKRKHTIASKIIWVNKAGANRGIGIHLGDTPQAKALKEFIETTLAEVPKDFATYTI